MSDQLQDDKKQNDISVNANSAANAGNSNTDENSIYTGESSLQTSEKFDSSKNKDRSKKENQVIASGVNDIASNSDGDAGTDKAGTAESKFYGDVELNKGLEAQARNAEG